MASESAAGPEQLRVGDTVEVLGIDAILATLDANGEHESLPFMPEMVKYCGQRLTVYKVAHKLCNTITGNVGLRKMTDAVHLTGARCDGSGHDGCQASCLIYWRTAWLKRVDASAAGPSPAPVAAVDRPTPAVLATATRSLAADGTVERYHCQATELLRAAPDPLPTRDLRQYIDDVRTGNVSAAWSLRAFLVAVYNRVQDLTSRRLPRWLRFRGGRRWGAITGSAVGPTPTERSDLQPGELVRIKSRREVSATLDQTLRNRGLGFDAEMARFCGTSARVAKRVDHIIDESSGQRLDMHNPCIVLEGIICEGAFSHSCPRAITPYFREIWLERVDERADSLPTAQTHGHR